MNAVSFFFYFGVQLGGYSGDIIPINPQLPKSVWSGFQVVKSRKSGLFPLTPSLPKQQKPAFAGFRAETVFTCPSCYKPLANSGDTNLILKAVNLAAFRFFHDHHFLKREPDSTPAAPGRLVFGADLYRCTDNCLRDGGSFYPLGCTLPSCASLRAASLNHFTPPST